MGCSSSKQSIECESIDAVPRAFEDEDEDLNWTKKRSPTKPPRAPNSPTEARALPNAKQKKKKKQSEPSAESSSNAQTQLAVKVETSKLSFTFMRDDVGLHDFEDCEEGDSTRASEGREASDEEILKGNKEGARAGCGDDLSDWNGSTADASASNGFVRDSETQTMGRRRRTFMDAATHATRTSSIDAQETNTEEEEEYQTQQVLLQSTPARARRTRDDELITRDYDDDDYEYDDDDDDDDDDDGIGGGRGDSMIVDDRDKRAQSSMSVRDDDFGLSRPMSPGLPMMMNLMMPSSSSSSVANNNNNNNNQISAQTQTLDYQEYVNNSDIMTDNKTRSKTPDNSQVLTVDKRVNSVTFKKQLRELLERKSSVKMRDLVTRKSSIDSGMMPGITPPTTPGGKNSSSEKKNPQRYFSHTTSMINRSAVSFIDATFEHSEEDIAFLLKSLRKSVLFADLKESTLRELIAVMWKESFEQSAAVVTQGEKGNALFLVAEGEFDVFERVQKTIDKVDSSTSLTIAETKQLQQQPLEKSRLGRESRESKEEESKVDIASEEEQKKRLSLEREESHVATSSERMRKNNLIAEHNNSASESQDQQVIAPVVAAAEIIEVKVNLKKPGDIFGELALMYGAPRSATVRASERSESNIWSTWVLPRRAFRAVAKRAAEDFRESIAVFMSLVPMFAPLSVAERLRVADAMEEVEFAANKTILRQGENAGDDSGFYIIVSGEALVYVNDDNEAKAIGNNNNNGGEDDDDEEESKLGIVVNHLFRSNFFGEKAMLFDKPRDATVKVGPNGPLRCLKLKRVDFVAMMGTLQDLVSRRNSVTQKRKMKKVKMSQESDDTSPIQQNYHAKGFGNNAVASSLSIDDTLQQQRDVDNRSTQTKEALSIGDDHYDDEFEVASKKSLVKTLPGVLRIRRVGTGSRNLFRQSSSMEEASIYRDVDAMGTFNESFVESITNGSFNASLEPFIFTVSEGTLIGGGAVGCVNECNHYDTQRKFAIKRVRKVAVKSSPEHVLSERKIVAELNHRSIISLHGAFQSDRHLYFLIDLMNGFDLMDALVSVATVRKMPHSTRPDAPLRKVLVGFDEDSARYYAALIVCAFEYLHELGIIYRDLKPENVFLDKSGRAKLGDFGFAKNIEESGHQTFTFCGTPGYVAPEMVLARGYSYGVDWWALGVLLYVIISGLQPFGQRGSGEKDNDSQPQNNPLQVMQRIADASFQVTYPIYTSEEGCDLIAGLLQRRVAKRLGNLKGGAQAIKNHPWFDNFDWESLENGTFSPPKLPEPSKSVLASHTARLAEIEKMVLEQETRDDEKGEDDPKLLAAREIFKDFK